jgi:hypothetical protein
MWKALTKDATSEEVEWVKHELNGKVVKPVELKQDEIYEIYTQDAKAVELSEEQVVRAELGIEETREQDCKGQQSGIDR